MFELLRSPSPRDVARTPDERSRLKWAGDHSIVVRVAMIAAGAVLLIASSVRLQTALSSEGPRAATVPEDAGQGFLPVLAQDLPIDQGEGVLRSGMDFRGGPSLLSQGSEQQKSVAVIPLDNRPVRLVIPSIGLDAPVISAALLKADGQDGNLFQWKAPDMFAVGWHYNSAQLGERGNTVLNGHHNAFGEVFRRLDELEEGERIFVFTNQDGQSFRYAISEVNILKERELPLDERLSNARYIQTTQDERLTLITCWPYETNTHRLVIIAYPLHRDVGGGYLGAE